MGNQPPPPTGPPPPPPGPPPGPADGQPPSLPTEPIQPVQPTQPIQPVQPTQPAYTPPAYGPPAGPPPKKGGIPAWGLAVGGGLLAAIAVVAVILLTRGGEDKAVVPLPSGQTTVVPTVSVSVSPPPVSPTASTSPTTSPTSTAPLTAEEQELLALIPEGHRGTCVRTDDQIYPAGFVGKLGCTDEDNALFVTYSLFRDAAAMNAAFDGQATGFPEGNCSETAEAQGTYTIGGAPAGRLLCYQAPPSTDPTGTEYAWVIWTDDQLLVFAFAARYDGNSQAIYTWWVEKSGPLHA